MKKFQIIIISIFLLFTTIKTYAKDTVFSLNKYDDEKYTLIKKSYNKNNKQDGFITGGYYKKETTDEDTSNDDYQVLLAKYKNDGSLAWTFSYGKTSKDNIIDLDYSYDETGIINGYFITMNHSYDINTEETINSKSMFLKIDLDGKLVFEKTSGLEKEEEIKKIIETCNSDSIQDGYLAIGTLSNNVGVIIRYNKDGDLLWSKEYPNITFKDITSIKDNNKVVGYAIIQETNEDKKTSLMRFDENDLLEIKEINEYVSYNLEETDQGFILYGITNDVKLKKGEQSYYVIHYNSNNEEEWETIGDIPIDSKKKLLLLPIEENEIIKEYLLLYGNSYDSSSEVIKLDLEGVFLKKVKKINNEYYDFENIEIRNDIIYLVGQINCPEDETCEYDSNSLFLISDEDKVIEVEDTDSKNILIVTSIIIIIIVLGFLIRKKRNS